MLRILLLLVIACVSLVLQAHAQTWPLRPIRLIVTNPPGGPIDIVARVMTSRLGPLLGQELFVDNRPGAGQILGTDLLAKAAPDGYTLGLLSPAHVTNPVLQTKLPYDSVRDFTPIERLVKLPLVLVVSAQSPANTVSEVIALARRRGSSFNFASSGVGTSPHLAGELLKSMAKLQMVHVPFNGTPEVTLSVMRGEIDMYFDSPAMLAGQFEGKLKPLAMTSVGRSSLAPNLPTMAETLPGYEFESFIGMAGPAKLPAEIMNSLSRSLAAVLAMPDVRAQLLNVKYEPAPLPPAEFAAYLGSEAAKFSNLIKSNGIKVD